MSRELCTHCDTRCEAFWRFLQATKITPSDTDELRKINNELGAGSKYDHCPHKDSLMTAIPIIVESVDTEE